MPRLSLYKPERGQDYKFMDRQISEMFQVGGTDVYLHKYMGPKLNPNGTADQPVIDTYNVTNIQDLLFLENRDRKYEEEIYRIRGIYNVQNIDFNLSQFGMFIDNDMIYMTVHINDFIKYIGRKPISGDVIEMPHLRDEFALNEYEISLPRYYVIEDVGRASEGFSATWYPHLYRLRCKKITDNQQFADILNRPAKDANGDPSDITLRELLSTYNTEIQINEQVLAQAEADAPKSGYETKQFYTLAVDDKGKPVLNTADANDILASENILATKSEGVPERTGYTGYLVGDGAPVNGYEPQDGTASPFGFGIQFPPAPAKDDFFLRTDFLPNRLFRFDGTRWIKVEDAVRMNMTNNDTRSTLKTSFINNNAFMYTDEVARDYIVLTKDQYVINTTIDYVSSVFVSLKIDAVEFGLPTEVITVPTNPLTDYANIISNNAGKVRVTLPIINGERQVIPYGGTWRLTLCNHREEQKQSLSKALKPKADF